MTDQVTNNLIEIALRAIKDRCDGGMTKDGKGYRPGDAAVVVRLLQQPVTEWKSEDYATAIKLLSRYRRQLAEFGINFDGLESTIEKNAPTALPALFDALFDSLQEDLFDAELIENNALVDRVQALIRLTRADYQNANNRQYTNASVEREFADAQRRVDAGLTIVGYDDTDLTDSELGHPDPVMNASGEDVGFDHNTRYKAGQPPAFRFVKFIYDGDTKEGRALIEPLVALESGQRFAKKLIDRVPVKFSLRALGDCELIDGKRVCELSLADGGDCVKTPAMPDAEVISVQHIADKKLTDHKEAILDCIYKRPGCKCSQCQQPTAPAIQLTDSISISKPLGDKPRPRPRVSGQIRKLGDAKMATSISEVLAQIAAEPDDATRKKLASLAGMLMTAEESAEGEDPAMDAMKKKTDPNMPPAPDPAMYDEKKIADAINKGIEDGLKKLLPADKLATLDAVEKDNAEKSAKKAVTDTIATIEAAGEFEGRKLENYAEQDLLDAFEIAKRKRTPEEAKAALVDSFNLYDKAAARRVSQGVITTSTAKGATAIIDEADKLYKAPMATLEKAILDIDRKKRTRGQLQEREELAKINKPLIDDIWNHALTSHREAFADWGKRAIKDSANPVTRADLLNQEGIIPGMIMKQTFQKTKALQFVRSFGPSQVSGDLGRQFKIPVTSFQGPVAGTTRKYGVIREGEAYGEVKSIMLFNKFFTQLRGRAVSIGKELQNQLKTGEIKLDAVALLISDASDEMARLTDTMILAEIQTTCDKYNAMPVTNEAVNANEWFAQGVNGLVSGALIVDYGGDIGEVTYGAGIDYCAKLLTGYLTGYTGHPRPIVAGQSDLSIADDNTETFTDNYDAVIATLGGVTQVVGDLVNGVIVDAYEGQNATCAVDKENGGVVFKATGTSGAAAGVRPTISYSYATNYNEFNLTPHANVPPEQHYSGILRMVNQMAGIMSSAPNYVEPDTFLMHTAIGRGAFSIADLFETRKSPGIALERGFADSGFLTDLYGISCVHCNGDFLAGARRGILFLKDNMSAYSVSRSMEWEGPEKRTISKGTGNRNVPIPEHLWTIDIEDVTGTPLVKGKDGNGNIVTLQHSGRTMRFVGELSSTTSN